MYTKKQISNVSKNDFLGSIKSIYINDCFFQTSTTLDRSHLTFFIIYQGTWHAVEVVSDHPRAMQTRQKPRQHRTLPTQITLLLLGKSLAITTIRTSTLWTQSSCVFFRGNPGEILTFTLPMLCLCHSACLRRASLSSMVSGYPRLGDGPLQLSL